MELRGHHPWRNPNLGRRICVVDREGVFDHAETITADLDPRSEVTRFRSALELVRMDGSEVLAIMAAVSSVGPLISDLIEFGDRAQTRIPTLLIGEVDSAVHRALLDRGHVRCLQQSDDPTVSKWIQDVFLMEALREAQYSHEARAQWLRTQRHRLLAHEAIDLGGFSELPCGPLLPSSVSEIQPLKGVRAQFERAWIQATAKQTAGLKGAAKAMGLSYTSVWRRLKSEDSDGT